MKPSELPKGEDLSVRSRRYSERYFRQVSVLASMVLTLWGASRSASNMRLSFKHVRTATNTVDFDWGHSTMNNRIQR